MILWQRCNKPRGPPPYVLADTTPRTPGVYGQGTRTGGSWQLSIFDCHMAGQLSLTNENRQ
jgi:hypothetical protein